MAMAEQKTYNRFPIEVSENGTEAWFLLEQDSEPRQVTKDHVLQALEAHGIEITDDVVRRADKFTTLTARARRSLERYLVARGRSPTEGKDGEFVWDQRFEKAAIDWQDHGPANYYTRNSVVTVEAGDAIGKIIPPVSANDGIDVYGRPLKPTRSARDVQLDATVRRVEDGSTTVIANVAGKVRYEEGRVWIDDVLAIRGDVDFETGNIHSTVDVHVAGTIRDLFEVTSSRSAYVGQSVEAAKVQVEGDLQVRGGILGRDKGSIKAGGMVIARFCAEAHIHAGGDVKVIKGVMNSHVWCGNKLLATSGALIGGEIFAKEGIEAGVLGSRGCVPTPIAVGIHPLVILEAARLESTAREKRKAARTIRERIEQVLTNPTAFSPRQVERAIALKSKADRTAASADAAEEQARKMIDEARPKGNPYILVAKAIHPGVDIRIGPSHAVFVDDMQGPVRVEEREIEDTTRIVAVNQVSGSVVVLPCTLALAGKAPVELASESNCLGQDATG